MKDVRQQRNQQIGTKRSKGQRRDDTYFGNPFQWLGCELRSIYAEEAQGSMRRYAQTEEFVIEGNLDVADITFLEVSSIFTVIDSFEISFVMVVNENFFTINNNNECVVVVNGVEALNLCHWKILTCLKRISNDLTSFSIHFDFVSDNLSSRCSN